MEPMRTQAYMAGSTGVQAHKNKKQKKRESSQTQTHGKAQGFFFLLKAHRLVGYGSILQKVGSQYQLVVEAFNNVD